VEIWCASSSERCNNISKVLRTKTRRWKLLQYCFLQLNCWEFMLNWFIFWIHPLPCRTFLPYRWPSQVFLSAKLFHLSVNIIKTTLFNCYSNPTSPPFITSSSKWATPQSFHTSSPPSRDTHNMNVKLNISCYWFNIQYGFMPLLIQTSWSLPASFQLSSWLNEPEEEQQPFCQCGFGRTSTNTTTRYSLHHSY